MATLRRFGINRMKFEILCIITLIERDMYRIFDFEMRFAERGRADMKILYVISDRNIGGAGILLCNILRNINTDQFRCTVALPFGSALRERILALGVPVRELSFNCDRYSWDSVQELKRIIKEVSPHIVHANAAICARIAGKLCGKKVVHTRHCCFPVEEHGNAAFRTAAHLGNRLLSDRVIATAEAAAVNLVQLGIPRRSIRVIVNGSEPVREVSDEELEALRAGLGLAPEDYCVGICARLEDCKGHDVFLRAAQIAVRQMPYQRFRFLIAGDGSRREELERMAAELGLSEVVRFTGFVEDMAPVYRLLRINVNCSNGTETSCLAISEGMSASLPTVASSYGGNRAMLGNGAVGICFPVGNAEALAEAICKIAGSPALEREMRSAARKRYEDHFTAAGMTRKLEKVYLGMF